VTNSIQEGSAKFKELFDVRTKKRRLTVMHLPDMTKNLEGIMKILQIRRLMVLRT